MLYEDLILCKEKKCHLLNDAGRSDKELAELYWQDYTSREKSIITALFCGQFQSYTQCVACSHVSSTYESFTMLQLPLPVTEMK